jgi:hypothetical protein
VSLIPGNVEVLAFGIQVDKDTPATTPVIAIALEDCSLDPGLNFITLAESDASALEGDDVIVGAGPGGTFKKYVRPSEEDFFLYDLLGKNVDSGTTPNFIHTATIDPAAPFATPYLTCWDIWPGVATVQYVGGRIAQGVYTSQAGAAWEAEYTFTALKALMHAAEPTLTGLLDEELPFTWPELTCSLGGVAGGVVNQASLTIARNTGRFVGDNGLVSLDIPNGLASVMGSMEVAFEDDTLWRAANTGSTSGTALTPAVFSEAIEIALARGAGLGLAFSLAAAQIKNFKVALKTDASPATATFDFKSKRSATLSDVISVVTKNALATADRS